MSYDFIVIGAGQAGLAIAYHLKQAGFNFLVVDGDNEIGGSWLRRWDSLTLFTPSQYNGLPGMDFPMAFGQYPGKQAVADYLADYVQYFDIPLMLNCQVEKLCRSEQGYTLHSKDEQLHSKRVIVATGPFHTPFIPRFASQLGSDILQLHSSEYKNPQQLQDGDTLVVGGGDSGVQILEELADHLDNVYFSGQCSSAVLPQEFLGKTLWWWLSTLGILAVSKYSWLGKLLSKKAQPIIGTDVKSLMARANVFAIGRALDANEHEMSFERGKVKTIKNIIWATGFKPDFDWIEGIELDESGYPLNYRGVSKQNGLFFIGLPWMYTRGSATLGGVREDAEYLAKQFSQTPSSIQTGVRG